MSRTALNAKIREVCSRNRGFYKPVIGRDLSLTDRQKTLFIHRRRMFFRLREELKGFEVDVEMTVFSLNEGCMTKDSRNAIRERRHHQPLKRGFSADSDSEGFNRKAISSWIKKVSEYLALRCEKKFGGRERFKRFEQGFILPRTHSSLGNGNS
uniref:Transposase n=1 Tax=Ascaris lumbricoides TaxID=6252 RepID=A0A0M3I0M8_ASCLU